MKIVFRSPRRAVRRKRDAIYHLGNWNAVRKGGPSPLADLYYWVMGLSWTAFILLVSVIFAAINVLFGLVYWSSPGSVANAAPGSLADNIFFSIDTLGTVGYGFMYPASHMTHAIASIEILLGLFFSATITGLIFARFARPRLSMAFSPIAVIGEYEGGPALLVRLAAIRARPLVDCTAQMACLETIHLAGGHSYRQLTDLALVRDRNPMFGLTWTLVHKIPEESRLLAALASGDRFMLSVTIMGMDTLLATQSFGGYRYTRDDICEGHEFVDIVSEEEGTVFVDMHRLGETRPLVA